MTKREPDPAVEDGNQVYLKRQKISRVASITSSSEVQSAQHLLQLLTFDQDVARARHGIQSFKVFLDGFLDEDVKKVRLPILKDYLRLQMPRDEEDKTAVYLNDLMQTWSFASQSNNDSLLSAVPAVLALLFRSISGVLELSEYGIRLGRTLLKKRQLELLARGLTSNKSKVFLISPCLRLIREVVTFDGGALAKEVFKWRDFTLKALARNLGLGYVGDEVEDRRKPSVRTNAVRFFLSCIKYLPVEAKRELLGQRDITSAATRGLMNDPPFSLADFLDTLKVHVLQNEHLSREAKSKFINSVNLGRIASLYGYERFDDEVVENKVPIDVLAHDFLILACTSPDAGVLRRQTGFYPRGIDPDVADLESQTFIDLGLEGLEWANQFTDKVLVRNGTLSEFIQTLRPWSNVKQSELILAIFKAAPELVADYYFGKKSFNFEPKLTSTWIGFSSLLYSTVQLPIPPYLGQDKQYSRLPPPSSIVIESILPQPLTQKSLTRCLNQKSPLVTFFAIRLLVVAFQKMKDILVRYREAGESGSSTWNQAAIQLTDMFCQRCPVMKDVINALRNCGEEDHTQRHATTKLLVMYYEVLPQIALESKFDVSSFLGQSLQRLKNTESELDEGSEDVEMQIREVENLLQVAHLSPGMRWFNRLDAIKLSPFGALLKLSIQAVRGVPVPLTRSILDSISMESGLLQCHTAKSAQDALTAALRLWLSVPHSGDAFDLLSKCALKCATTPIRYINALEQHYAAAYGEDLDSGKLQTLPLSLLLLAIEDQWCHLVNDEQKWNFEAESYASFIAPYLAASIKIGEDEKIIRRIIDTMVAACPKSESAKQIIENTLGCIKDLDIPDPPQTSSPSPVVVENQTKAQEKDLGPSMLEASEDKLDPNALTRWTTKEIEEIVEDGHASALVLLLTSLHLSVRKEALSNIAKLAHRIKESEYEGRDQFYLLLSEVVETSRPHIDTQPLPTTIAVFVAHAVAVLRDPLHCLYPKVNIFLTQGPSWEIDKLPLMHAILNEPPSTDDAHYAELSFLLAYLSSGLRTPSDMAVFHKRRVFEKLLSLYGNAYLATGLKDKILGIVWRATAVEGGSTTLVTRFSILSWLRAQMGVEGETTREADADMVGDGSGNGQNRKRLGTLMERVLRTCDGEKLMTWSGKGVKSWLTELRGP